MRKIKCLAVLKCILFSFCIHAQNFSWQSKIDPVPENGFYSIPLSMDWLLHSKTDLADTRIQDDLRKPVPYLIKKKVVIRSSEFINFPIITYTDSIITTLEVDALVRPGLNELFLIMGNSGVERSASLSGSNDGRQWYIVEENITLQRGIREKENYIQKVIFPFIGYRYLKLRINNKGTDPLAIIKAGVFKESPLADESRFKFHPGTSYLQRDSSDGNSYVWIRNDLAYPVNKIDIDLTGPRFYKRPVKIFDAQVQGNLNFLGEAELNPAQEPVIRVNAGKTNELLLVIQNGENPPLKFNSVKTSGIIPEIIAYLEKGKNYLLLAGDSMLKSPDYELRHFRDSIPAVSPILNIGPVEAINTVQKPVEGKNSWLWPSIIVMVLVLGLLAFKLLKEMKS
jgi:hypothetical protein